MLIKNKSLSFPRKLADSTIRKSLPVFSVKVNLVYILHLIALKCCLLHLIKKICLLKTSLRFLMFMNHVSLNLLLLELSENAQYFCNSQGGLMTS